MPRFGGRDGDFSQLLVTRIDVQRAVGHEKHAAIPHVAVGDEQKQISRHQFCARFRLQNLERRAQGIGRRVHGTGHKTVRQLLLHKHHAKAGRRQHVSTRLFERHALMFSQFIKRFSHRLNVFVGLRIHERDIIQRYVRKIGPDRLAVTDQNDMGDAFCYRDRGRLQYASVI